jgi:hypothetical protein
VQPFLRAGSAVISTDHVVKGDGQGRSRYAFGGVMKLNMVNGASYLVEAKTPITRGGTGESRVFLTKDRPGSIKPSCAVSGDSPAIRLAGVLQVESEGDGPGELEITIQAPALEEATDRAERVREALHLILMSPGLEGEEWVSKSKLVEKLSGRKQTKLDLIDYAVEQGAIREREEQRGLKTLKFYTPVDKEAIGE